MGGEKNAKELTTPRISRTRITYATRAQRWMRKLIHVLDTGSYSRVIGLSCGPLPLIQSPGVIYIYDPHGNLFGHLSLPSFGEVVTAGRFLQYLLPITLNKTPSLEHVH